MNRYYAIILVLIVVAGCGRRDLNNDLKIFRYNEAAGITSLDPAYARDLANIWACNQIFDGLVKLDDELMVQPSVAKSWEISPDGLTYTFHMRDDVYFHDHHLFPDSSGRKVSAFDAEYSFKRILDPKIASPGVWVFNQVEENGFKALNDSVFQISLVNPFMPFLGLLAMQYCNIVPQEIVNYYGKDFRQHPVGCGPFSYQYWKEGVKMVLHRNPDYYLVDDVGTNLPYLDGIAITFLIDKQSAFLQFVQGKIDFLSGIDASYKDELLTPEGRLNPEYSDRINLIREPYLNTEYLGIMINDTLESNMNNPLKEKLIRQAVSYGFDRVKMMRYLRNNIGIPGNKGMIPPGMPGYLTDADYGYHYDPELAGRLLDEAGYPQGEGLPELTLTTSPEYLDLCKYIQHELNMLGMAISISVSPPAAIKEMKAQAKLPFFRASWIADYPDAENYLSLFYSKNFCPAGPNYTHFSSPDYDMLYETSLGIVDDIERFSTYSKLDSMVMVEAPVVILFYDEVLRFTGRDISGLGSNPINLLDLTFVDKK